LGYEVNHESIAALTQPDDIEMRRKTMIMLAGAVVALSGAIGYRYYENQLSQDMVAKARPQNADTQSLDGTASGPLLQPSVALFELFGITASDGPIMVTPNQRAELWFAQTFDDGSDKAHVVFLTVHDVNEHGVVIDQSHAGAPTIGAVTYKQVDGKWLPVSRQRQITRIGAWGKAPNIKQADVLRLGNVTALLIEAGSMGQGYMSTGKVVLALEKEGWRVLGWVETAADNRGACVDGTDATANPSAPLCWAYKGHIVVGQQRPGMQYPDLIVERTGTVEDDSHRLVPAGAVTIRFNGESYGTID